MEILSTLTDLAGNPLDGDADGSAGGSYVLTGDDENRVYKLAGDFNGDGGVSILDFPTFSYWFGHSSGPSGVAPEYVDLNGDGGVSIFDFPVFAGQFGEAVSLPTPLSGVVTLDSLSSDSTHPVRDAVEHSDAISLDLLETPLDPRVVRRDEVWNRLDREPARLDIDHPALDELLDEIGAHVLRGWTTG